MQVLLTYPPEARRQYYGERALSTLRSLAEVKLHEGADVLQPADLIEAGREVDLIIADRLTTGPAPIFASLPKLKAFIRCAVDIGNIDVAAASVAGVLVTRARPGFADAVAELAVGLMVDLSRGISRTTADFHAGRRPEVRMGRQLSGSTIGIIGYGQIGRRLAPIAAALGMGVLVADPFVAVEDPPFRQVRLEVLLAAVDYVVCLAVATDSTENLIDTAALARMKRDAVFINLSRGNLVDETALAQALSNGLIAGAAMDVGRAIDQMPSPGLARLPNVIATPHIGGLTPPAVEAQAFDTVGQVRAILLREIPRGAVNADRWTRRLFL